jgi:hypothetical protein
MNACQFPQQSMSIEFFHDELKSAIEVSRSEKRMAPKAKE